MSSLRRVVLAVLVAAVLAGGFTYIVSPPSPVEADQRLAPIAPAVTGIDAGPPARIAQDRSAEDFLRAAMAILKPLSNAQASARADELPIFGHVPLPKRRPIPR
jgi:hypothetical protein